MGVSVSYTVHCDKCGEWVSEEMTRREAVKAARKAGFVRKRDEEGCLDWLCPSEREDVCGEKFTYERWSQWCLSKPNHEGGHDWST